MLKGHHVRSSYKAYKGKKPFALQNISFELQQGRITTFMGPSGAGKTTLLHCMANLHKEYDGEITVNGKDLRTLSPLERASHVGFVLQQCALFPHLTVLQNCVQPLVKVLKLQEDLARSSALRMLSLLGMANFKDALPAQLSGGQQQRVAIARALVLNPEVLLLDEPTSALDPESKLCLVGVLKELNQKGITIGLSSHDMPFIQRMLDCIYFMEEGAIIETYDCRHECLQSKSKINRFLTLA